MTNKEVGASCAAVVAGLCLVVMSHLFGRLDRSTADQFRTDAGIFVGYVLSAIFVARVILALVAVGWR